MRSSRKKSGARLYRRMCPNIGGIPFFFFSVNGCFVHMGHRFVHRIAPSVLLKISFGGGAWSSSTPLETPYPSLYYIKVHLSKKGCPVVKAVTPLEPPNPSLY